MAFSHRGFMCFRITWCLTLYRVTARRATRCVTRGAELPTSTTCQVTGLRRASRIHRPIGRSAPLATMPGSMSAVCGGRVLVISNVARTYSICEKSSGKLPRRSSRRDRRPRRTMRRPRHAPRARRCAARCQGFPPSRAPAGVAHPFWPERSINPCFPGSFLGRCKSRASPPAPGMWAGLHAPAT